MIESLEFSNGLVRWIFHNKKIELSFDRVIRTSINKRNRYVVIETGENFITKQRYFYDFFGARLLFCNDQSGAIDWVMHGQKHSMEIPNLRNIGLFLKKNVLIVIYLANEKEGIIFDLEGNFVAELEKWPNYEMAYLQEFPEYISVVMEGSEETEDKYGRRTRNFKINLSTGELEEVGLAY